MLRCGRIWPLPDLLIATDAQAGGIATLRVFRFPCSNVEFDPKSPTENSLRSFPAGICVDGVEERC